MHLLPFISGCKNEKNQHRQVRILPDVLSVLSFQSPGQSHGHHQFVRGCLRGLICSCTLLCSLRLTFPEQIVAGEGQTYRVLQPRRQHVCQGEGRGTLATGSQVYQAGQYFKKLQIFL